MGEVVKLSGRRPREFEDSVAHSDLKYWGYWKGLQYAAEGYSPMSTLTQILSGRTDNPGHKILCLDMKPRAWDINAKVFTLNQQLIDVLVARYCIPLKPDGHPYENSELARFLGITHSLYRHRLAEGRRQYKALVFPENFVFQSARDVVNS